LSKDSISVMAMSMELAPESTTIHQLFYALYINYANYVTVTITVS